MTAFGLDDSIPLRVALDPLPEVGDLLVAQMISANLRSPAAGEPSSSVKPYSRASRLDQNDPPERSMISGSAASATTARPLNLGVSPKLMSSPCELHVAVLGASVACESRPSVRTRPGHSETTATPWGRSSSAVSRVILSIAALPTPYGTESR